MVDFLLPGTLNSHDDSIWLALPIGVQVVLLAFVVAVVVALLVAVVVITALQVPFILLLLVVRPVRHYVM